MGSLNKKMFTVESGSENWDYSADTPTREVLDYWVKFGNELVKKFSFRSDAEAYAKKLNKAINPILKQSY